MKHWTLFGMCLLGLGVAAFFTVRTLHHGPTNPETFREKEAVDENVLFADKDELYPEGSALLFGKNSFPHVFSHLRKVDRVEDILTSGENVFYGWIIKDSSEYGVLAKVVYWSETMRWEGDGWTPFTKKTLVSPVIPEPKAEKKRPSTVSREKPSENLLGDRTGKFSAMSEVPSVRNLASGEKLSRGWVVNGFGTHTNIARAYWDGSYYWLSPYARLGGDDFMKKGIVYTPENKGWDGTTGNNWPVITAMLFGMFFVALLVFGYLELVLNESWNK